MALVSYEASSSDSEIEDNSTTCASPFLITNTEEKVNGSVQNSDIFNSLPQPKKSDELIEEVQDEFLAKKPIETEEKPKKLKQTVKIGIPSLKDFENVEEDQGHTIKSKTPLQKTSGLFSILPPPKVAPLTNKSFIPNVLLKPAPKVAVKNLKKIPKKFLKDATVEGSDDEGDDIEIPDTFDDETWKKVCGRKKPTAAKRKTAEPISSTSNVAVKLAPELEKYDGLDNVAFKELVGSNKRRKENIKLIDIHEEDIVPDNDTWLLKSLTDPDCVPKEETEEPVNDTCKKKHHITYLAQQARANEQELQSQWSQNKFTRKQTQSKYGF